VPAPSLARVSPAAAVQVLFVIFGIAIAAFFPFLALFLSDRGLSPARIGVVIAAMAVARIVAGPVWGHVADTTIGRRTTLQIGALGAGIVAIAMFLVDGYAAIVALGFVFAVFSTTTGPNLDAIALEHLGDERMGEYGRIRAWESLSYAVACLAIGITLELTSPAWTMPIYAAGILAVGAWAFTLRHDRPAHRAQHGRLGAVGAVFREAPKFWQFLVALLLVWTGFNAAWNFIALKIERGGGGPLLVGIGAALGGLVEVPVMRMSSRLGRAWGLRPVFVLGCSIYALGFLLWGLIENPTVVSLLTIFEGMAFGLLFTTGVVVIGRMLPSSLYSTGQSMWVTASFGVAPILGAGIGGWVFETFGTLTLYAGASSLALAGAAISWIALSDPVVANPEPEIEPVL
jgi:MFS transporter, PPP family, 3-phenylpropionic acid transporter